MGVGRPNLILKTDYAIEENPTVLELHMDIPFPERDKAQIQEFLAHEDWDSLGNYFGRHVPPLRALVKEWIDATGRNKSGNVLPLKVSAS